MIKTTQSLNCRIPSSVVVINEKDTETHSFYFKFLRSIHIIYCELNNAKVESTNSMDLFEYVCFDCRLKIL